MNFQDLINQNPMEFNLGLIILMIWSLIWKGLALWHASKRQDKVWFVILLILNTAGIAEIIYLIVTRNKKETEIQNS